MVALNTKEYTTTIINILIVHSKKKDINMDTPNYNKPALKLTKLEYALIHSTWEPAKNDVEFHLNLEQRANPYNDSFRPKRRSYSEVVRDLKIDHFKQLLS